MWGCGNREGAEVAAGAGLVGADVGTGAGGSVDNDRRAMASAWPTRIAEKSLYYGMKIRKLLLFICNMCNVMIFRWFVVAAKKAQRRHIEGRKNVLVGLYAIAVGT